MIKKQKKQKNKNQICLRPFFCFLFKIACINAINYTFKTDFSPKNMFLWNWCVTFNKNRSKKKILTIFQDKFIAKIVSQIFHLSILFLKLKKASIILFLKLKKALDYTHWIDFNCATPSEISPAFCEKNQKEKQRGKKLQKVLS